VTPLLPAPPEVPPDVPPDELPDVPPDVPPEVPPDVPPDESPDEPPEVPPEVPPDEPPDAPPEVPPDEPPELPPEEPPELPPDEPPPGAAWAVIVQEAVAVAVDLACEAVTLSVCWPGARFVNVAGDEHPVAARRSSEHLKLAPNVACHAKVADVDVVWDVGWDVNETVIGSAPDHFAGFAARRTRVRRKSVRRTCLAG
jgi:hypothetical protein